MRLLLLSLIFCLFSINSFATIQPCGEDSADRRYSLSWEHAASYRVKTSFVNLKAIVCVGINFDTLELKRLHYRDDTGIKRNYSISELKNKDIVLFKRSDFPPAARLLIRKVDPLTIRIISDRKVAEKRHYKIRFKFVRNIAIGWSSLDVRELPVYGVISNSAFNPVTIFYKDSRSNTKTVFDTIALKVGGNFKIESANLYSNNKFMKSVKATSLKKVKRK